MGIYKNKPGLQDFMKKINNEEVKGSLDLTSQKPADWVPYGDVTASYYVQWDSDISNPGNYVGTFATAGGVQPSIAFSSLPASSGVVLKVDSGTPEDADLQKIIKSHGLKPYKGSDPLVCLEDSNGDKYSITEILAKQITPYAHDLVIKVLFKLTKDVHDIGERLTNIEKLLEDKGK